MITVKKNRFYEIFFDDELIFQVHPPFFHYVKKITSSTFDTKKSCLQALLDVEFGYGKRYAIWTMSRAQIHSAKLRERLLSKKISLENTTRILEECQSRGYLNDEDYVQHKAEKLAKKGKSRKAILYSLPGLRSSKNLPDMPKDYDILLSLLPKRFSPLLDPSTPKQAQDKLLRRLIRQGFSLRDILSALKELQS